MIKNHDMVRSMLEKFPPDENGDALRNMQESGDDLSKSRDIDFSILFQNGGSAKSFCEIAAARGWKVCISAADGGIWDVTVTSNMVHGTAFITTFGSNERKERRMGMFCCPAVKLVVDNAEFISLL
jgi:Regulator of ribonuclease activity B